MFRPTSALTFDNAAATLDAGLKAIASGQSEIDLAELEAVDSSTVSVLLAWQRAASEKGIQLQVQNIPSNLESLMDLYGLTGLLSFRSGQSAAVSAD